MSMHDKLHRRVTLYERARGGGQDDHSCGKGDSRAHDEEELIRVEPSFFILLLDRSVLGCTERSRQTQLPRLIHNTTLSVTDSRVTRRFQVGHDAVNNKLHLL